MTVVFHSGLTVQWYFSVLQYNKSVLQYHLQWHRRSKNEAKNNNKTPHLFIEYYKGVLQYCLQW